ncbi:MAG: BON domain-containing protein [Planctomycetota bacterium]|nr:MAG: BON domain-containing protein [Planctomycetota bacterium]
MYRIVVPSLILLAMSACSDNNRKAESDTHRSSSSTSSDHNANTTNERSSSQDRTTPVPTAGNQSETAADRKITQEIRKAVMDDSDMSMAARNATIVTINGVVTLRGTVQNASERQSIAAKANRVSGVRRVENLLEVSR